jgi:hypothetical protein
MESFAMWWTSICQWHGPILKLGFDGVANEATLIDPEVISIPVSRPSSVLVL